MGRRGDTALSSPRILLVYKQSTITRLGGDDMAKLINAGVTNLNRLESAHAQHQGVLKAVRQVIGADCIGERWVGDCTKADCDQADLVVCVGGDGTVFGVQRWLTHQPLIAVNSDPARSVGHVTRLTVDAVAQLWPRGRWAMPAKNACRGCRFASKTRRTPTRKPAFPSSTTASLPIKTLREMTRYQLVSPDGEEELQYSSGIWIATAAGSTAAIASAGFGQTYNDQEAALLFLVREPFKQRNHQLIKGAQLPPVGLTITAALPRCRFTLMVPIRRGQFPGAQAPTFQHAPSRCDFCYRSNTSSLV